MRKLILSIFLGTGLSLFAQDNSYNKWSIGYNMGGHTLAYPTASRFTRLQEFQVSHHNLNGRYMINNRIGVMLNVGYDFFDYVGQGKQNTHFFRVNLQSVINIGDIIKLYDLHERFGLLMHVGIGGGTMWQKNPAEKKDNVLNAVVGLTPQLRLSNRFSLNFDFSLNVNGLQRSTFDKMSKISAGKASATIVGANTDNPSVIIKTPSVGNLLGNAVQKSTLGVFFVPSIGVTYHIGKHKTHADWTPTQYAVADKFDPTPLQNRISELEEMLKDDDNDGVVNSRDLEPNTPAGVPVNSLGQEIKKPVDTDGDGFTDDVDECPNEYGRIYGCPDTDYDGIPDKDDACPTEHGKPENKGCPVSQETLDIIRKVSEAIYFNTGKSTIKQESFPELDKLANILKNNPDVAVSIEGHTDNVGNAAKNLQLSKDRAKAVRTYLINKGVGADRIKSEGYGSTRPIASNDTEDGRSQNRRVAINTSTFKQSIKVAP